VEPAGHIEAATAVEYFGAPVLLMVAPEAALLAALPATGPVGYWTSDAVLRAALRAAADRLSGG
jgi:hypothetical protein